MAAAPRWAQACFLLLLQAILLGLPSLQPCTAENVMYATKGKQDFLYAGQSLQYGSYNFKMQEDCNLVLYDGDVAQWHSNTAPGGPRCRATLTYDGVLEVSNERGNKLWSSKREERVDNYVLVLQRDRNVVIYGKPLWATDTKLGATLNKGKASNVTSEVAEEALNKGKASNVTSEVAEEALNKGKAAEEALNKGKASNVTSEVAEEALNKGKASNVTSEVASNVTSEVAEEATGLGRKMIHMVVNNLE